MPKVWLRTWGWTSYFGIQLKENSDEVVTVAIFSILSYIFVVVRITFGYFCKWIQSLKQSQLDLCFVRVYIWLYSIHNAFLHAFFIMTSYFVVCRCLSRNLCRFRCINLFETSRLPAHARMLRHERGTWLATVQWPGRVCCACADRTTGSSGGSGVVHLTYGDVTTW